MKKLSCKGHIHPFFLILLILLLAIPMGFYGMYLYIAPSLPEMSTLKRAPLLKPLQVYTSDQKLIAEFGSKLSIPVEYKEIPPHMVHALLAAEDSTFFEHSGVSFKGLGRAITESVTGTGQSGGSTITMQVAKNYYLSPERTLRRKLTEVFLARKIESNLSKEDILTLYVNKIFLGKNAYGIKAAAYIYYNKDLSEISLAQMAMIAGLPKAPSKYNPVANPDRALERRNWILGRMLQLGYIQRAEYEAAIAEPINLNMIDRSVSTRFPYVAELVRTELVKQFGEQVMDSGFKVFTTVHSERQAYAEQAVQEGLEAYDRRHGWRGVEAHNQPLQQFYTVANMWPAEVIKVNAQTFQARLKDGTELTVPWSGMAWARSYRSANSVGNGPSKASDLVKVKDIVRLRPNADKTVWSLVQIPKVQGQLIALNPNNGAVEAVVGGYNFYHSKFNRATQGWRQPGSTIKPFVYALALERGMTPYSMVNDSPITIGKWSPRNSDGRYLGAIPLRRALYLSRNTVSVRLLQNVGIERARQLFMDFGLSENEIPRNYTIALGTPQVLPIQMATGYATFANGGYRVQPFLISKIEDAFGDTIFQADPEYACISCLDEQRNADVDTPEASANDAIIEVTNQHDGDIEVKQIDQSDDNNATDSARSGQDLTQYRQAKRILKSSSAYDMANILRDVIQHGTGRAALRIGRNDLGGKTGTTNDAKDAWFAGFNGELVAITWVGFDQPTTLGRREYGGIAALPIWTDFMAKSLANRPERWVKLRKDEEANETVFDIDGNMLDVKKYRASPPVARPLYRPAPKPAAPDHDFADLPGTSPAATPPPSPAAPQLPPSSTPAINNAEVNEVSPHQIF